MERLLLNDPSYPVIKYFDVLATDEHERAILNRYPASMVQLQSLQAENALLKETLAVHAPQHAMLLQAVQSENTLLKGRMAKHGRLAETWGRVSLSAGHVVRRWVRVARGAKTTSPSCCSVISRAVRPGTSHSKSFAL